MTPQERALKKRAEKLAGKSPAEISAMRAEMAAKKEAYAAKLAAEKTEADNLHDALNVEEKRTLVWVIVTLSNYGVMMPPCVEGLRLTDEEMRTGRHTFGRPDDAKYHESKDAAEAALQELRLSLKGSK